MAKRGKRQKTGTKRHRRTEDQRHRDLALCARMYLQGYTQREIRDSLNTRDGVKYQLSHVTVHNDLTKARELWLASALVDIDQVKARQLARLDLIERETWEAWEQSKEGDNSPGDIQFLKLALQIVKDRNEVMGLATLNINLTPGGPAEDDNDTQEVTFVEVKETVQQMDKTDLIRLVHGTADEADFLDFENVTDGDSSSEEE